MLCTREGDRGEGRLLEGVRRARGVFQLVGVTATLLLNVRVIDDERHDVRPGLSPELMGLVETVVSCLEASAVLLDIVRLRVRDLLRLASGEKIVRSTWAGV